MALRRAPGARPLPLWRRSHRQRRGPSARRGDRPPSLSTPKGRHLATRLEPGRAGVVRRRRRPGGALALGDAPGDARAHLVGGTGGAGHRSPSLVTTYVALLRGINVGGRNPIRMPALKTCFEAEGFEDVATYIQSGNVLFRTAGSGSTLVRRIEEMLSTAFDYRASVVLRSRAQVRAVVEKAPKAFGAE